MNDAMNFLNARQQFVQHPKGARCFTDIRAQPGLLSPLCWLIGACTVLVLAKPKDVHKKSQNDRL